MSKLNLRQAREKAGVSVEFVAEQMGVSVELVKSWEAGERSPEMAQGFSLSMLYGMSLNDITFNLQAQEAKERQGERVDLKSNIVEKLPQCKRVAEQLGEIAGVSSKTIYNTETILTKGTKEDIQALVLPLWAPLCLL